MPDNERIGGIEFEASIDTSRLDKSGQQLEASLSKVEKSTRKTEKALTDAEKAATKTGTAFGGLFKQFTAAGIVANVVTGAFYRVTAAIAQFIKGSITAASNLTELDSKARVVFGSSFPKIAEQARSIGAEVGRASSTILKFATDMGAIISSFGIAGPLLEQMSTQFAQLAVDMASFMNTTDEEAFSALRSGITGETEPLKRFGIVLTDANLELFALSKGIKTSMQDMNQAQKTALRYAFIMDKTSLAQGDAARTADSYANQSRRLSGEIQTLQEQLGRAVTPGLASGLGVLSASIQNVRIYVGLLMEDISSLFSMLNFSIGGTTIGKTVKGAVADVVGAVPVIGPLLKKQGAFALSRISSRIGDVKTSELAAEKSALIDPLANFGSLGGATPGQGAGAEKLANDVLKAEDAILQALAEQADANKEILTQRRDELLLRQKLGLLTTKEGRELDQINRRMEFSNEAIDDMVNKWEEMQQKIEQSSDRLKDLRKSLKDLQDDLAKTLGKIDEDTAKSRKDKIVELLKEQNDIRSKGSGTQGITGDMSFRLGEIQDELKGATPEELAAAQLIAGTPDSPGMNDLAQISADAQEEKNKLIEEEKTKREEILNQIEAERDKMDKLKAESIQAQKEIVQAVTDRATIQAATFSLMEERTTAHVNHEIAEFNRLKSALNGTPVTATQTFAGGGAVFGPGTETSDSINARLSHNEHVLTASDVRAMGGHGAVMQFRNDLHRLLPRFAEGGPVMHNNQRSATINITNHGRAAEVFADPSRARWHARTFL